MRFFVTCAKGTEGALRRELVDLRVHAPRGEAGGVSFEGAFADGMKVCLHARVAMRVLLEAGAFHAGNADELYAGVRAIDWGAHLNARTTLAVSASVQDNAAIVHSGFAALKVKDAVVDALRDRLGARPDVDARDPDLAIFLHLRGTEGRVFLDLAGEPLHRRGYRVAMTRAPLKETLAAAVLALGGVRTDLPFIDAMCGSGTLAIEHALAARDIAPGLGRRFGFERWPAQEHAATWRALREEARARVRPAAPASIRARDIDASALAAARANARAAAVEADITFEQGDARALTALAPAGTICLNPPYGERLSAAPADSRPPPGRGDHFSDRRPQRPVHPDQDLLAFYRDLSRTFEGPTHMKRDSSESPRPTTTFGKRWRIVVLSGNRLFAHAMRRKADVSHRLWNGPLEARLLVYRPKDESG
jgi:23S rRNA G2445 N2-methylase RlmL